MCPSLQNVEVGHYGRSRVWVHAEWWQACECGLHMLESLNFVQVRSLIGSLCRVMSHQRSACQQDALYKLFLSLIQLIWCNFFSTWIAVYKMPAVWTDQLFVHFCFLSSSMIGWEMQTSIEVVWKVILEKRWDWAYMGLHEHIDSILNQSGQYMYISSSCMLVSFRQLSVWCPWLHAFR